VRPEPSDVVHQDVEARVGVEHLCRQPADLRLRRHVGDEHVDAGIARLARNLRRGLIGAPTVTPRDADPGAHRGKADRGSPADLLLTDRPLLICVALWAVVVALIIYRPF